MKSHLTFTRAYAAMLLLLLSIFAVACSSKEGTVESVNMLYGKDSKVWKTAKEKDASGNKVAQTAADKDTELRFYANGNFNLAAPTQTMSGTYTFDQTGKKISLTPTGGTAALGFNVETLTDDKLTLVATDGSKMMLEKE